MAHNDFFNTGNKGPLGKYSPLYPHDLGRPLKHEEQDYNAALSGQIINGYRVFGTGTQGAISSSDIDKGLKLHEITTLDADYNLYLAAGMEAGDYIWIPAAMGGASSSPLSILSVTANNVNLCTNVNGGNGSISLIGSGGTPAYSYRLESPALGYDSGWVATAQFTSLAAGTYTASIQDSLGAVAQYQSTITVGTITAHTLTTTTTNPTCYGDSDGSLTVSAAGGQEPYTIAVAGQTNQTASEGQVRTFSSLAAGSYAITVTDSNNCTVNDTLTITAPAQVTTSISYTVPSCEDATDHQVDFSGTAGGDGGPYEYSIDGGGTWFASASFTGLSVGQVIEPQVKDASGCVNDTYPVYTFVNPSTLQFTAAQNNIGCFGANAGSIFVSSITGGQTAYPDFQFSKDGGVNWVSGNGISGTSHTFSSLAAGTYDIQVRRTDGVNFSCAESQSVVVVENPEITHDTPTITVDSSCSGGNGTITVANLGGGTEPYTSELRDANNNMIDNQSGLASGDTVGPIPNIASGSYTFQLIDSTGCESTLVPITVADNSSAPTLSFNDTNANCNGGNGTVDWTIVGGVAPFDVELLQGGNVVQSELNTSNTTGTFTMVAGQYEITVTDLLGCSAAPQSFTITEPTAITGQVTVVPETIAGQNDGQITVQLSGGALPYQIVQIENTATGNGYSCNPSLGCSNGTDTFNFTGLAPGNYEIVAASTAGSCDADIVGNVYTVNVGSQALSVVSLTAPAIDCNGDQVAPTLEIVGGGGSYAYSADGVNYGTPTASTTNTFPTVPAGTYIYYAKDTTTNDVVQQQITITEPSALGESSSVVNETTNGANDGQITVTPSGGTSPYSVLLDGVTISTSPYTFTGLADGVYPYTVTDANGCEAPGSATVAQGGAVVSAVSLQQTTITCNGGTATVTMTVTGGSGDYEFSDDNINWSTSQTQTTYDFENISAGSYTFYVRDTNVPAQTANDSITVTEPSAVSGNATVTHETVAGYDDGEIVIVPSGGSGVYTSVELNGVTVNSAPFEFTGLADETYTATIIDDNGCEGTIDVTVNAGVTPLTATFTFTEPVCASDQGFATIQAFDGIGPYFYSTNDGASWFAMPTNPTTIGVSGPASDRDWKVKDSSNPVTEAAYANNPQQFTYPVGLTLDSTVWSDGSGTFDCNTTSLTATLTISGVTAAPEISIPSLSVSGASFSDNGNGTYSYTTPAITDLTSHSYTITETATGNVWNCTDNDLTGNLKAGGYYDLQVSSTLVVEPACPGDDWTYQFDLSYAIGSTQLTHEYSIDGGANWVTGFTSGSNINLSQNGGNTTVKFRQASSCPSVDETVDTRNITTPVITITSSDLTPTCYPTQGSFAFTISGGLAGASAGQFYYEFSNDGGGTWQNAEQYSGQVTFPNLTNGEYVVNAWRESSTGQSGKDTCEGTTGALAVTLPTEITWDSNVTLTDPSGCQTSDGQIRILTVQGGDDSSGYTFSTSGQGGTYNTYPGNNPGVNGGIDFTINGLDNGTYNVWIQDSSGCQYSIGSYTLNNPNSPVINSVVVEGCPSTDLANPAFEHDSTNRVGLIATVNATSANSMTYTDNAGSPSNTTGIFTYPNTYTDSTFAVQFTVTDDATGCSTSYSYNLSGSPAQSAQLITGGAATSVDDGTGTSTITVGPISGGDPNYTVTLLNYSASGHSGIGDGGTSTHTNNVVDIVANVTSGSTAQFTNVPNGNYMYEIVDSDNCVAFNPAQIVANAASVNERTIYYFHGAGGGSSWPTAGTGVNLISAVAYFYGSPGGDYQGGVGTFTEDLTGNASLSQAMDYICSFVDPNTGQGDIPVIDTGNPPGYEGASTDYVVYSYEMPGGQTIQDNGDPVTRTTFTFPAYSTNAAYFYLLVPNNADFPEDLTSGNNYLYDLTFNTPTSAAERAAVNLNGEDYWIYRLSTAAVTSGFSIAFNN